MERPRVAQPAPTISPPASTPTASVVPQPVAAASITSTATSTATAQPAKVDLLGDLGGDPFGKKSLLGKRKCAQINVQNRQILAENIE